MATYTLYWRTGDKETVQGCNIAEAMTLAGYSGGAVRALDFYTDNETPCPIYSWNAEKREWVYDRYSDE
jgi:hypothetical protein